MVEDSSVIGLIVKECCKGIEYDEILKQYSFALMPDCDKKWEILKPDLKRRLGGFSIGNYNEVLSLILRAYPSCNKVFLSQGIEDVQLLPGESLEILTDKENFVLTKMGRNQYLTNSGKGLTFPSQQRFQQGVILNTSEGVDLGLILDINLRTPTQLQNILGHIILTGYYKKKIKPTLWSLYEYSEDIRINSGEPSKILDISRDLGIGILPMMTIINSFLR